MFLGIDLGTSGVKVVLVDESQNILASETEALRVARRASGWSEQNPEDWITATQKALAALDAAHDLSGVKGIGLSGQMHGATLLGQDHQPLRPCILWNDTRSHAEAAALDADVNFRFTTGNIVFPGFTAPKLAWVKANEPGVFAETRIVLLPKDFLRLWLTGEAVSEMSDAAGTAWLDTAKRDWSDTLLAKTDLSRDHMPCLVEGSEVSGTLRPEIADAFGMSSAVVVAGGGGDNAASAIGAGVIKAGQAFVSLGTSGVLFAANDGYQPDPASALHTFCHALPDTWHQMGVILAATDALNWYARITEEDAGKMTGALGALQAPGRAMFLPYLGGERTPHNDAKVRGAFIGLEHATDRAATTRAVLEGVTFAFMDSAKAMSATGTQLERLIAVGGGARSDYWLSAIATALNVPVDLPQDGDFGGSFGAARLGMMAAGAQASDVATPPNIARTFEPVAGLQGIFAQAHERYGAAYRALRDLS